MRTKSILSGVFCMVVILALTAHGTFFGRVHRPNFTILHFADIHAGSVSDCCGAYSNQLSATLQACIDSNSAWNTTIASLPGDLFEQGTATNTVSAPYTTITNLPDQLKKLRNVGISVYATPGNHDGDGQINGGGNAWTNIFPLSFFSSDPSFSSTMNAGDTRDMVFLQTNSGIKCVFVNVRWCGSQDGTNSDAATVQTYQPFITWAISNLNYYSNYVGFLQTHFMVDGNGTLGFEDTNSFPPYQHLGPGLALWTNAAATCPNLAAILVGHTQVNQLTTTYLTANDGHTVPILKFNTQDTIQVTTNGSSYNVTNGQYVQVLQVIPDLHAIHVGTFDGVNRKWVTNGTWGAVHDFYFPVRTL